MIRTICVVSAAFAAVALATSAQARIEGPWCANYTFGADGVESDCSFFSIEECRPHIVAGNRGYCGLNPRYRGPEPLSRKSRAYR